MRVLIFAIVALFVACSPNACQAQVGPGETDEPAPGPLGGAGRVVPGAEEPGAADTQESVVPQSDLPSVPSVPPPEVDDQPLQEPLTLGPFEEGQTQEEPAVTGQQAQSQQQAQPLQQQEPRQQGETLQQQEQPQAQPQQPLQQPAQPQVQPEPQAQPQAGLQQQPQTQVPQGQQLQTVQPTQIPAPQAATQFAAPDTTAIQELLLEQQTLWEERQQLLDEREALLEQRESYLEERANELQAREDRLLDRAAELAAREDEITVGEFFTGDAARYAEQFGDRPDQFQPGTEGGAFSPGPDNETFSPGPTDTRSPFFTTENPPESP
jgi:hypothetical protein